MAAEERESVCENFISVSAQAEAMKNETTLSVTVILECMSE